MKTNAKILHWLVIFVLSTLLFNVEAIAQTTLFIEDFETASIGQTPPASWAVDVVTGSNAIYFKSAGTWPTCNPYSGTRMVEFQSFIYSSAENRLKRTIPISTIGYTNITVDFSWLTDPGFAMNSDRVNVQYSLNGTTWTTVATFNRYASSQVWTQPSVALPANAANQSALYIAFDFISTYGNNCHLDLVHIRGTVSPLAIPFTEDWETASVGQTPPSGWNVNLVVGSDYTWFQSSGTWPVCTPYSGNRMVEFQSFMAVAGTRNSLRMTTPVSTIGYSNISVDFWWLTDPSYNLTPCDRVDLSYSINGITWMTVGTFNRYAPTQQWTLQTVTLPANAANQPTLYIAFDFISAYGVNCHLDLVHINGIALPTVTTTGATSVGNTTATLNGQVNPNGSPTAVNFNYGLTNSYTSSVPGTPGTITGYIPAGVSANLTGLAMNTTYHYCCVGINAMGASYGADKTFTTGCPTAGAAGSVSGPTSLCANTSGVVYSVGAIPNANGYAWSVPPGSVITAGANTTSITVTFGSVSGNVSVYGTGLCGNGTPSNLAVTVNPMPAPIINGADNVCESSAYYTYTTEPGMNNYIWDMSPYSGTITWVIGSNQVTIFWNSAGARWVSVSYTTPDGCTPAAPTVLNVAVSPSPPTPVITLNGNTLVSNAADGNQWYLNNCAIPGAKEQTYIAVYCGDYTDIVTSNGCSSQISNKITVIVSGIVPESAAGQWNIYPNPSQGHFTLSITSGYQEIIDLSILNNLGIPVYNKSGITVNGNHQEVIDLPGLLPGIYPVVLNTADWHSTQKVVIY